MPWETDSLVPFGRYYLGARIATGGMGEVYLAKMKGAAGFEKRVVIKKILPQLSRDPEFVKRFIDEGKLAVKLSHANIVPVLDLGEVNGDYYLAMEYVDGADLRQVLRLLAAEGRRLPLDVAIYVLVEVCRGLHYAHCRTSDDGRPLGIIHRDISPANVMVSRDGAVRIVDFGIAKAADRLAHSVTGALQGKFVYMSPEQARGEALDPRSDIFSLGSVAYELLTGVRPFEGRTDLQTLERVKRAEPAPIRDVLPSIPERIADAIHRCLAPVPDDRFASVEALQRVLQDHLFDLDSPPGDKELGAFVRDLVGARPTPAVASRGQSLDELLSAELDRVGRGSPGGVHATSTATQDIPRVGVNGVPGTPTGGTGNGVVPSNGTGTLTQTGVGTNRMLIGGLFALIAVLLYFNIQNLLTERAVDPAGAGPDAGQAAIPTAGPTPGADDAAAGPGATTAMTTAKDAEHAVSTAPGADVAADATADGDARGPVEPDAGSAADAVAAVDVAPPVAIRLLRLDGLVAGDRVRVDDTPVTPDESGQVELPTSGPALVVVERDHHTPFEHEVAAEDAAPAPVEVSLRPARKSIEVRSVPEHARLRIDGRDAGAAPQRVTVTWGRSIPVEARLPGHEPARATLRYGSPSAVTLTLKPNPMGRLVFRYYPASAHVFIDGKRVRTGATNLIDRELPAGSHRLLIRASDGSTEKSRDFKIDPGKTANLATINLID